MTGDFVPSGKKGEINRKSRRNLKFVHSWKTKMSLEIEEQLPEMYTLVITLLAIASLLKFNLMVSNGFIKEV